MKTPRAIALGIVVYFLCSVSSVADESTGKPSKLSEGVLVGAGSLASVILASKWASRSPETFGTTFALFAPIATSSEAGYRDSWPVLLFFESLAIYNIAAARNDVPEDELYRNNLGMWGLFLLVGFSVSMFEAEDDELALSFYPRGDGGMISVGYRF